VPGGLIKEGNRMEYVELGATGLEVGVAGLGCGGNSRLGLGTGSSENDAVGLVRAAFDLGVNLFDTAEAYGTEGVVGRAAKEIGRDKVVISSKSRIRFGERVLDGAGVVENLEASLDRLGTDYVDVFHLHAIPPNLYDHVLEEILPSLLRAKQNGKIRHLGITETSPSDHEQRMLRRALSAESCWEVVMFAFHMMNQGARGNVFPNTLKRRVGTLLMFVVRNIFSNPEVLSRTVRALIESGSLSREMVDPDGPLDFLIHPGGAENVVEAAYRYARHELGADVVLFGTGRTEHVAANVRSILLPPLPEVDHAKLGELFGHLTGVGLDLPDRLKKT
jgi:aryl-alcohol dehydrogenase-like predicted oxidoreductase